MDTDRHRRPARPSHADEALAESVGAIADLNDAMQQLHTGIKTNNAIRRLGADVKPIINGASCKLSNSPGKVVGYSIRETTGAAAAVVRLRDGFDASGDLIASIAIPAGTSKEPWTSGGYTFTAGLFVEVVSGSVEGVVYTGTTLR